MARMYGAYGKPCCPHCRWPSGPDCADKARGKRQQRRIEGRQWRRDWADDIEFAEAERMDLETLTLMISRYRNGDVREYLDRYGYDAPLW